MYRLTTEVYFLFFRRNKADMYKESVDILLEKCLNQIEISMSHSATSFYIMQKFLGIQFSMEKQEKRKLGIHI